MNSTTNSLFSTDIVVSVENVTLGKIIAAAAVIIIFAALVKKITA